MQGETIDMDTIILSPFVEVNAANRTSRIGRRDEY